jgi:hypothetical protein
MINEEKVILMTRASLYEGKEKKKNLKIYHYFRHDYISLQLLVGWFFATISFALGVMLWGACNMEYLLDNLHKMDLKSFGMSLLLFYILTVAVYLCLLYGVYSLRYRKAQRSVSGYAKTLKKISAVYVKEKKTPTSKAKMEDIKHDSIT